jgi:hypothetical protein
MINLADQSSRGNYSPNIMGDGNSVLIGIKNKVSNEVKTIQLIIHTLTRLSRSNIAEISHTNREIDPEHKVSERFAPYSAQLKQLYGDLSIKYSEHYSVVTKENQVARTDIDDVSSFLQRTSLAFLIKNDQNPILALHDLVVYLESNFYEDDIQDFQYDSGAISFYLYNQLIACNVFPNPIDG